MSESGRLPVALRPAVAIIFLILVAGGLWLRSRESADVVPPPAPVVAAPVADAPPPPPPPILGRADLIDAAAAATDAYATGAQRSMEGDLAGRRFAVKIIFGCNGASSPTSESLLRWDYDPEEEVLRVSARPVSFTSAPWLTRIAGDGAFEAAEGFWIDRPWQRTAACPAYRSALNSSVLATPQQTLALVELFVAGERRSKRRDDRPYEVVKKATPEEVAAIRGFALVAEGRIVALPDGAPVGCWNANADIRPTCVIGAGFERVSIENIATGEMLADWRR